MSDKAHIALIHRLVEELFNRTNLKVADALYAPTYLLNDLATRVEDLKDAVVTIHGLIPGFRVTVSDVVQDGEMVAAAWTIHSRSREIAVGSRPAGRARSWTGLRLFRI